MNTKHRISGVSTRKIYLRKTGFEYSQLVNFRPHPFPQWQKEYWPDCKLILPKATILFLSHTSVLFQTCPTTIVNFLPLLYRRLESVQLQSLPRHTSHLHRDTAIMIIYKVCTLSLFLHAGRHRTAPQSLELGLV